MYFDYLATTPLDAQVFDAMRPYWTEIFGNPHSTDHGYGYEAEQAVRKSAQQLSALLPEKERQGQWVFTSGATEANNLVIKGVVENSEKKKILVSAIEHPCVLEAAKYLKQKGYDVVFLPVTNDGVLDLDELEKHLSEDVLLVSVMWANNEIGVIQPIKDISRMCQKQGVLFHSDCAQAFGKLPLHEYEEYFPDFISISGHKYYGPKGVGALWIKKGQESKIAAQIHGGGQQKGIRSGTLPVPLIVGAAEAASIALNTSEDEHKRLGHLRDQFEHDLRNAIPDLGVNGEKASRLPHVSHIQIPDVDAGDLISAMSEFALSRGSACSSEDVTKVSHVMAAMRMEFFAHECLRISFGRPTTNEEVEILTNTLIETVRAIKG